MKKLNYIFLVGCLWLTACTESVELPGEPQPTETEKTVVHLNLQSAEISVDTRSTTPQDPQTDNPMYHLYLLHYNDEGQLIADDTQANNLGGLPQLTYQWSPVLRVTPGVVETVCLIANMNGNAPSEWPNTLAKLKEACATLQLSADGLIADKKMYMFGYYEGALSSHQSINIMMGRMAATAKFVISTKNTSNRYRITKIEIQNASRETYYFPHRSTEGNFKGTISETWPANDDNNAIGNGLSSERNYYYQIGENITPADNRRTTVVITAQKGTKSKNKWSYDTAKTYTVVLGADAPGTANRNYSLYRNNNYTFNIDLN